MAGTRRGDGRKNPSRATRAHVYDGIGPVKIIRCLIRDVDPTTYTATVVDENGGVMTGIPINPTYINSNGGGLYWVPEPNTPALLCWTSTDRTPLVLAGTVLPQQLEENNDAEDPNNARFNRPYATPGDLVLSSGDGNYVVARRGGNVEIRANETTRRVYVPLGNLISDLCENYELVNVGGTMELKARRVEDVDKTRTPIEFRLNLKEFAQDKPIIDIGLGRIKEEDEQRVVTGAKGAIIARVIINNRFKFWVDRDGNVQSRISGKQYHTYDKSVVEYYHESHRVRVMAQMVAEIGTRDTKILQNDRLVVNGSQEVVVKTAKSETVIGPTTRILGPVVEVINGSETREVVGSISEQATNETQLLTGAKTTNVSESWGSAVGKTWNVVIANAGGDSVAGQILVNSTLPGEFRIHNNSGKLRISCGTTPETNQVELLLKPSGAFVLKSSFGQAEVEVNATGVQLRTKAGSITLDKAGTVSLGGTSGLGNVVTTTTHPVDFVTGAPIRGSASVRASGSGIPGPSALPSVFLKDSS